MEFPMSVLLKSNDNNKFLCYREKEGRDHSSLNFSQEEGDEKAAEIQYLKFEIQEAESVKGLVHIRNCYNHKYWVRKSADSKWIVAEANEPDEDQSKSSCTLFKIIPAEYMSDEPAASSEDKPQRIRLMHIDHLGKHYAFMSETTGEDDHDSELALDDKEDSASRSLSDDGNSFIMYNVSSVAVLPRVAAFKGHNGLYCSPITTGGITYMESNAVDIGQEGVLQNINHLIEKYGGACGIENVLAGTWMTNTWRMTKDHSYVVTAGRLSVTYVLFRPIALGGTNVALRATDFDGTVWPFVQCVNELGRTHLLRVNATTINNQARFEVVEPVLLRVVDNVNFNIRNSRVYNVSTVTKFSDIRANNTSVEQTGSFRVSYTTSQTTNWNHGVTMTTGVTASWSSSIPFVGSFGVELSMERSQSREWGVEEVEEQTVEYEQNLTIPPRKKIGLRVIATKAFCDIPFTCEVKDTLTTGTIMSYTKRDGLFEGSNEYNFVTEMTEEDL